ncbi:MAG: Ig-like domain-containing protein, partial [Opitutales bacterium]|nr:Ig-like domain-containing protein [Opitutales bacterium]
ALYVHGVKVGSSGPGAYPYKFDFLMPQYGSIDVWAMARFSNGNRVRSETLSYVLNTGSAPTVELLSPLNGASFLPGSEVKIFATAYDADSLISTIDFFVNDTYVNTVARVDNDSDDDGLFETVASSRNLFEFNYQFPFAGDYRIFAQATDETGRTTRSNVAIVTAGSPDRSIPVVSMSSPASVSSVGVGSSLWLNAHATDEDGSIRSVKFFANGQEIGETVSGWGDDYAFAFNARSPGVYYVYAQAKDNHGKIAQSPTVRLDVKPITAPVPTVYLREIDPIYQDLPAGLETVVFSGEVNAPSGAGVLGIYANGVLLGKMNVANGFFNVGMIPMFVGNASITAAVEDGGNTVVSNARSLRVAPQSKNIDFLDYVINNMLCGYFFEEFLDDNIGASVYYQELVRSLDNGQRTPAEFIHELMMADDGMRDADSSALPALNFARVKNALMIRWALTGQWPTNAQMASDCEIIRLVGGNGEGSGERRLVRLLMPAFQMNFFDGKRIPDSFSDKGDFEDFIKVLFDRKFGVAPTKAQLDRCVTVLQMGGTEWFVRDFLLDEDAMRFGNGTVSTLLGIPNLPNHRLSDYANSASLFIGLLRIVPLQSDVEGRANLPLIQQIQIILDAMPEI